MVITCEVLWSARLNTIMRYINWRFTYLLTYLLTGNRQEDRSSQWEATKKSVGRWDLQQQGWSAPTESDINDGERRLFDISSAPTSGVWDWTAEIETVIDIATPRRRLKSSEDRSLGSCERSASCIRSLSKLGLVTFFGNRANQPIDCITVEFIDWSNDRNYNTENIKKDIRLFCLIVVVVHKLHLIWR